MLKVKFHFSHLMLPPELCQENGEPDYLKMILTSRVYDVCKETPCSPALSLSEKFGSEIYLKREDLQPVYSFKLRGAYNMMAQLDDEKRWKGVISCSAGNHAQGVAYSAAKLGIPATIVMPLATPTIKYENVQRLGAKVLLYGQNFDEAKEECARLQKEYGMTYIPPFDDPYVIAGQGTIGLEILRQIDISKLKAIFLCIGGGGLISGVAAYVKRIAPHVKIIGVETYDGDAMTRSIKKGELVTLDDVGLFADGAAVRVVGTETFRIAKKLIDEMVLVNTDEICAAINDVFNDTRAITEPTGSLSVAGMKKWLTIHPEECGANNAYVAVLSGANMNFDRLRFVAERSRLGAGKEVFFIVEMDEQPGSFKKLIDVLAPRQITEFTYRMSAREKARVYISFSTENREEIPSIIKTIESTGQKAYDVSDNSLAKDHARYMVGGHAGAKNERVFRFRFPEKPGALARFLSLLNMEWNISMFHYRNNGSDIASVLAGIQVPDNCCDSLHNFLHQVGYPYTDETENQAYKMFLQ